jgi:hypothetical protein
VSLAPDVVVSRGELAPTRAVDIDTGKLMVAGLALRGPINKAVECLSLQQLSDAIGGRDPGSVIYDSGEFFFHQGGKRFVFARAAGPSATKAKRALLDGSAGTSLTAEALYVGAYANAFTVQVTHPTGSTFQIVTVYTDSNGVTQTETSPEFVDTAAADLWGGSGDPTLTSSAVITLKQGASTNDPAVLAASALNGTTTGTDDRVNITATEKTTALGLFNRDYGPGQVAYAGATDTATHALVQTHAEAFGRVPMLSAPDSGTTASVLAVAATDRTAIDTASHKLSRNGGLFWPWIQYAPLTSGGTPRLIPPGIAAAGLMARSDGAGKLPNAPAAGDNGVLFDALGVSQLALSDTVRAQFNDAGINVFVDRDNQVKLYGYRTLADPSTDSNWLWLNNARFYSLIYWQALDVMEGFQFSEDNPNILPSLVRSALTDMLMPYFTLGSLVGEKPSEAFGVDMSANTAATAQAGRLLTTLELRMAPLNERSEITLVKVPITAQLS